MGIYSIVLLLLWRLVADAVAAGNVTSRYGPYRHTCVRYSCDIHWCILGDGDAPSAGAFNDKASCLYWQFLGDDCGDLTSDVHKLPQSAATPVKCPEDGQIYTATFHIWRSPAPALDANPLRLIWGADANTPAMVNSTMVAGTCTKEEKKLNCRKGTPFGDCISKSLSCPMVPNPDWRP